MDERELMQSSLWLELVNEVRFQHHEVDRCKRLGLPEEAEKHNDKRWEALCKQGILRKSKRLLDCQELEACYQLKVAVAFINGKYKEYYSGEGDSTDTFERYWEFPTAEMAKEAKERTRCEIKAKKWNRCSVTLDGVNKGKLVLIVDNMYWE